MNATITPTRTTRVVLPGLVEPSGLLVEEAAVERPGCGQLLIEVEATGVSFAEQAMRRGRYFGQPAFPFTPGYDLVGRVLEVGPGGDHALLGQRVAVMTKTGAWAGHAVVAARDAVVVPDGVLPEQAEAVTVNGVTAWQMLHRAARVERGGTVLLFGASGGVGGILIQLAHHAGIRVIGAASPRHHDALRAAGVEPVDYADPDLARIVLRLAPGGVDAVFDNIGGDVTKLGFELLAPGGALVTYSIISAVQGTGSVWPAFMKALGRLLAWDALPNGRHAAFYDLWAGHSLRPRRFRARLQEDLGQVLALVADGTLTASIAGRFPLAEAAAALELAESRTVAGKVILVP
ncbi:NADPH:quinone reductase [Clavibacter lycopersici]|uniref:NADPH:quinone reductase n=1 Tax=Clavibacter lycopersici TaxID=2301718 RepID=A0A399TBD5_9MICO|nr:zinc-binding dehydrogenase [Clavibacter lycopersici]RIJ52342.1 NADPH:quinone reductase [Clavibacter lycopersici]RIJ61075.1 NADPH:quinone reductase [Clavibacter lycopersici]